MLHRDPDNLMIIYSNLIQSNLIYKTSINFFVFPVGVTGFPGPIPATAGWKVGYTQVASLSQGNTVAPTLSHMHT